MVTPLDIDLKCVRRFRCSVCGHDGTHMLLRSLGWAVAIAHPTVPRRCVRCGRGPYRTKMVPEPAGEGK